MGSSSEVLPWTSKPARRNFSTLFSKSVQASGFIRPDQAMQEQASVMGMSKSARRLRKFLDSSHCECVVALVVILSLTLLIMDTNARADESSGGPQWWVSRLLDLSYLLLLAEIGVRIFVERRSFLDSMPNRIDLFVLGVGAVEYLLVTVGRSVEVLSVLRVVRLCRLLRMLRLIRLFSCLNELRRLLMMMSSCFRTVFWSFALLFFLMTVWAVVYVELINPYVKELAAQGMWSDCSRCHQAFSSVFMANLTLFSTIVAGDSWGQVALPIMELQPWTAFIFVPSMMSLVYGILHLIVVVMVDTFAKDKARDIDGIVAELDKEEANEKRELAQIFAEIDVDNNGQLSCEELFVAAEKVPAFSKWLRFLDIDSQDLVVLFQMVDSDESGSIDPKEFIEAMYRFKNNEPRTATFFVKFLMERLTDKQKVTEDRVEEYRQEQRELLDAITDKQREMLFESDGKRKEILSEGQEHLLERLAAMEDNVSTQLKQMSSMGVDCQSDPESMASVAEQLEVLQCTAQQAARQLRHAPQIPGFPPARALARRSQAKLAGQARSRVEAELAAGVLLEAEAEANLDAEARPARPEHTGDSTEVGPRLEAAGSVPAGGLLSSAGITSEEAVFRGPLGDPSGRPFRQLEAI